MDDPNIALPLIEPSVARAMATIEVAEDLPEDKRRHWMCSLRIIAKALGRPPQLVAGRWTAVRIPISRLHHAQMGVTAKTLANHKANVRAALSCSPRRGTCPREERRSSRDWARLRDGITHLRTRAHLYSPMRFWSAQGVAPEKVNETALDACMGYRAATTALKADFAARRRIARAWNSCVGVVPGWPSQRLVEPPLKASLRGPAWDEFPAGLRRDIEAYLESLTRVRCNAGGRRLAPCKPKTIEVCRAKLVAFVRKAVSIGVPINDLCSFRELFDPDLVERVFDAYWRDNGEHPSGYLRSRPARLERRQADPLPR